ncbi:hypothetical protein R3I94_004755 [Phoxinus phoxinus]
MGTSGSQPVQPNPELDRPWREFDWGQKVLKEKLENFSLWSSPDVKDIKILVAGEIGAGKSSFINSVNSAFRGRICAEALVDTTTGADSHSFTKNLKAHPIRGENYLPFVFKDIMGLQPGALAGSQTDDIINAVFGHVKDGHKFSMEKPLTHEDQHYNKDPKLSDQAFCLVFVIAANTVQLTNEKLFDKLKIIRKRISDKGIPQVVVMTKVDEACPLVDKDLRKIYTSKKIKEKMDLCSAKIGLPLSNIFPVKNYNIEIDTKGDIDALILKALEQIIQIANDRLVDIQATDQNHI